MADNTQEVFASAIRALVEHPEAIKLLIENEPLSAAITHYIDASAEALKPEWREVWRLQYDVLRKYPIPEASWRFNSEAKSFTVQLDFVVEFCEKRHAAKATAKLADASWSAYPFEFRPFFEQAIVAQSYTRAVEWGQSLHQRVIDAFETETLENDDGGAS